VLHSLPGLSKDWKVDSRLFSQAEDARLAVYENLRARTVPLSPGGWRLVLDHAPRGERLPVASSLVTAGGAAPGPAGGVTVGEGGGAFSAGGRAGSAARDTATFFSVTIAVQPPERSDGDHQGGWIDKITGAVKTYMNKNTTEGLLVQSVAGECLTLRGAILYAEARDRHNLQQYLRTHLVIPGLPPGAGEGHVTYVSTGNEDARHAVYATLRREVAAGAAGAGEAGQPCPPPATMTRTLVVLDTVAAPPAPPAAAPPRVPPVALRGLLGEA
jgi:hypothetical protein